ncbi:testis-expressed protein 101 isoform X1 [Orcinus orca]|uniref:testis-expressed protein 101 isoform X1 n=2 Tax=Orcinus orca TaxID=9733 RepID=UPI0021128839|nr:testis-expressed protein 101 isoform X1 [Orcinus orca]
MCPDRKDPDRFFQTSLREAMGACHFQVLLFLFLLGAPTLILAQNLRCQKSAFVGIEADPVETFNWTTDKAETCDNGALCQETVLMIKAAGTKTAILATKGCSSDGAPAITFIQHTPAPGLVAISYSNYCEDSFCNNKEDLHELWRTEEIDAPRGSTDLRCPTCLALGSCLNAPSLSCPNDTNQCYQGKLQVTGGDLSAPLEIKGCTSADGCRLMSGIFTIGPLRVKETCPLRSISPRKVESGATWLHTSVWRLELLLPLSLQALVH